MPHGPESLTAQAVRRRMMRLRAPIEWQGSTPGP